MSEEKKTEVVKTPVKVYSSRLGAMVFLLANGKPCNFVDGKYATIEPNEIKELDTEIAMGHPSLYLDGTIQEGKVMLAGEDQLAGLKARLLEEARAQLIAEHEAASIEAEKTPEAVAAADKIAAFQKEAAFRAQQTGNITTSGQLEATAAAKA